MGLPASHRVSVPRGTQDPDQIFAAFVYRTLTLFGRPFQCRSTSSYFLMSVLQPRTSRNQSGLGSSAFARHYSRNTLFSSGYLDVSVPRVPRYMAMCSPCAVLAFPRTGFPIRISTAHRSSAAPRSFSQRYTSFFGSRRLGIPRVLLVA